MENIRNHSVLKYKLDKKYIKNKLDITNRIKTFQDALNYNGETLTQFNNRIKNDTSDEIGYKKSKAIVLALNEGDKIKSGYYPWFWSDSSLGCISFCVCGRSSLLLKNSNLAIYAGNHFAIQYSEMINP